PHHRPGVDGRGGAGLPPAARDRGPLPRPQALPAPAPGTALDRATGGGHVAVCVYAAVIEALLSRALLGADVRDPDLADQHLSAPRALRELARIKAVTLDVEQ